MTAFVYSCPLIREPVIVNYMCTARDHFGDLKQLFKMTICYDQGCNDIAVVIATKCLSIIYAYIFAWMHLHRTSLGRNSSQGYHYVVKNVC